MRRLVFVIAFVCFFGSSAVWAQGSLLQKLTEYRLDYRAPLTPTEIGELLTRTALSEPGWGVLKKDAGFRCPTPMQIEIACDHLVWIATGAGFDVLIDAEGEAVPTWRPSDVFPADRIVVPWRPNTEPEAGEPPESAADPSHELILESLADLNLRVSELRAYVEREAAALRAEHAQAASHHETDDQQPVTSSKADLILSTLAAIGAAVAAALGAQ